jgi:hypothetical protein
MPMAILEAMSLGRSVISTDVDGIRELVSPGETGLLLPDQDCELQFRNALLALAGDPVQTAALGLAGQARYEELFTAERMIERYARVFRELCRLPVTRSKAATVFRRCEESLGVSSFADRDGAKALAEPSHPLKRYVQSAFSVGKGFEAQPPGRFFDPEAVRGYFLDFREKTTASDAHLPHTRYPAGLAQLALGWWERFLAGDHRAMGEFEQICSLFQRQMERHGAAATWPYPTGVRKYKMNPPWCSAMAQGQIISVFTRAYLATGEPEYAAVARAGCLPLLSPGNLGLVVVTSNGPVLEEAPSRPASHILNGWIFALWGLWDASVGLGDSQAAEMFASSLECLRRTVDDYDIGWWTRYSLYPHLIADLAKPFYHKLHIAQMEILYLLSGFREFRDAADRWRSYDRRERRVGVVVHKTVFVATKYI